MASSAASAGANGSKTSQGQRRPEKAGDGQRRPEKAGDGQRRPEKAGAGAARPKTLAEMKGRGGPIAAHGASSAGDDDVPFRGFDVPPARYPMPHLSAGAASSAGRGDDDDDWSSFAGGWAGVEPTDGGAFGPSSDAGRSELAFRSAASMGSAPQLSSAFLHSSSAQAGVFSPSSTRALDTTKGLRKGAKASPYCGTGGGRAQPEASVDALDALWEAAKPKG